MNGIGLVGDENTTGAKFIIICSSFPQFIDLHQLHQLHPPLSLPPTTACCSSHSPFDFLIFPSTVLYCPCAAINKLKYFNNNITGIYLFS